MANIAEIKTSILAFHRQAEELENLMELAAKDKRFKFTPEDSRKVRDLIDDAWLLGNRAWRSTIKVPISFEKVVKK